MSTSHNPTAGLDATLRQMRAIRAGARYAELVAIHEAYDYGSLPGRAPTDAEIDEGAALARSLGVTGPYNQYE